MLSKVTTDVKALHESAGRRWAACAHEKLKDVQQNKLIIGRGIPRIPDKVYIHPYMDGNGRMGRFLMNLMLGAGGYPWTVVPTEKRSAYMDALEQASVTENIGPFADFLGGLVRRGMAGGKPPTVPKS